MFVDGRTDLYGDEVIGNWMYVMGGGDEWQARLDDMGITLVVIENHWAFNDLLQQPDSGWDVLLAGRNGVLYQRAVP